MSTEQATPKEETVVVQESADGGAIVDLPSSIPNPQSDDVGSDEIDERDRQREMAVGGAVDPDAEALREAKRLKRQKRKEYHKQAQSEKDLALQQLRRENSALESRLANMEKRTFTQDLEKVDQRVDEEDHRILFAKQKMKEAIETGNGDLLVSAQELLQDSTKAREALVLQKMRSTQPRPQPVKAPDVRVQRYATDWMARNSWYDPQGGDPDSKRALLEDQFLVEEGYDPRTEEYWDELSKRVAKYKPQGYTDDANEAPSRTSRPRNVVTASGRESMPASHNGSGNAFKLSPEQVRAMKDAGMWDDEKKRSKMIARYVKESQIIRERG